MLDDLRFALRQLVKNPNVTIVAIFALALGIGANTAIFSVVNAVLLRPLPYPDADKLIVLRERSNAFERGSVGYMNWLDWHAAQKSFTELALVRRESVNFSLGAGVGSPERLRGVRASSGFLTGLGLKPKIGRDLSAADDIAGAPNVALISESLWRHHFAGSPSVLGRRVLIDGLAREIIGVFPAELQFGRNPDVLLPLSEIANVPWMRNRDNHQGFWALGRLKPGVTISQAMTDLNAIAIDLEKKYPQTNTGRRVTMRPLFETTVGDYRASLNLLLAAVLCVLLIACANVANLQLARALARGREIAVRAALGASRWVIARQLLVESTLLAVIGAVVHGCNSRADTVEAAAFSRGKDRFPRARFHHIRGVAGWRARWCLARLANFKQRIDFARAARSRRPQRERRATQPPHALWSRDHAGSARNRSARRCGTDLEKFLACSERAARFRSARGRKFRNFAARREVQNKRAEGRVLDPVVATHPEPSWR